MRLKKYSIKNELAKTDRRIEAMLVELADARGTVRYEYISKSIEDSHKRRLELQAKLDELESAASAYSSSAQEFDVLRDTLASFAGAVGMMPLEQKREMLRALVKKAVWDGGNVHLFLFSADDGFDLPKPGKNEATEIESQKQYTRCGSHAVT